MSTTWAVLVAAVFTAALLALGLGLRGATDIWFFRGMGLLALTAALGISGSAMFGS